MLITLGENTAADAKQDHSMAMYSGPGLMTEDYCDFVKITSCPIRDQAEVGPSRLLHVTVVGAFGIEIVLPVLICMPCEGGITFETDS